MGVHVTLCYFVGLRFSFFFQGYYYFAIVEDFILRFGWALNLSLTTMGYVHSDIMISILSPLEVFRYVMHKFSILSCCTELFFDIEEDHKMQVFVNTVLKKIFLHKITEARNGKLTHSVIYMLLVVVRKRSLFTGYVDQMVKQ
jgi:hypothetical protein